MINQEIAKIFYLMSEYLQMENADAFKIAAYSRASRTLEAMTEDLVLVHARGGQKAIEEISGIGQGLAEKIIEFIQTKKIVEFDKLRQDCPVDFKALISIQGLGPKMIKVLYEKLQVTNLESLERAARAGKIRSLPRFGEKVEHNILRGVEFIKRNHDRFLLGLILPTVWELVLYLRQSPQAIKVEVVGSVRRRMEAVGDINVLVASDSPAKIIKQFIAWPRAEKIWGQGATKASIRWRDGFNVDLRVVAPGAWGAALLYFTGSKEHNAALYQLARIKGWKLNEYGLWRLKDKREVKIASLTERAVYQKLGLAYIEPELRENLGEIEAATVKSLPKLVGYQAILGDLHMHTDWSDGAVGIEAMAKEAKKLGRKYIAITDHAGNLKIANALDEKRLLQQMAEIDKISRRISGIKILKGAEVDVDKQGNLDMSESVLAKLDLVLAAVHSQMNQDKKTVTQRMLRAIRNPLVNIIAHPTGRVLQAREGYQLDFDQILAAAKQANTFLEIDAYFDRLDLSDRHIKRAKEAGVKLSIGTDSHHPNQLWLLELGVGQARRGWAEANDIINTRTFGELKKLFKKY